MLSHLNISKAMTRLLNCVKLQCEAEGLDTPPFPGQLGNKIFEQVSKKAWDMWLAHQTMLINEYRLNLADPDSRRFLKEEMDKYFFGPGSTAPSGFIKPDN